jgi:hypothetical protein
MAKGQNRDSHKERFWRDHLRRFQASGLTVRDYCARHRLAEPSFYGWRRTLAQRDQVAAPIPEPAVTFLPVEVQPDQLGSLVAFELVLANGRLLRIPPDIEPRRLRDLLVVLEEPSC